MIPEDRPSRTAGGRRRLLGVVLAGAAVTVLATAVTLTYGLAAAYGAGTSGVGVLLVLLPAVVALAGLLAAGRLMRATGRTTGVLAVAVLVLFAGAAAAADHYGGQVRERELAAEAVPCSARAEEVLTSIETSGQRAEPVGDASGSCSVVVVTGPDAERATADVTAALDRDGWRRLPPQGDALRYERPRALLQVIVRSDGEATEVLLSVQT